MTDQKPLLTRAEIVALARQIADLDTADPLHNDMITLMVWELERFVDKVAERAAAAEREACKTECWKVATRPIAHEQYRSGANDCFDQIKARGGA